MIAILFFSLLYPMYSHPFTVERSLAVDNSISNGASIYLFSTSSNLYLNEDFIPEGEDSDPESSLECFIVKTWTLPWKINASYEKTQGEIQMQGCSSGLWVMAVNGGGSNVTVKSKKAYGWETFIYEREGTETLLLRKDENYLRVVDNIIQADTNDRSMAERFIVKKMIERVEPNIYGVNLGGWLVPEKWITPKLFSLSNTTDVHSLCLKLGTFGCEKVLLEHYSTFIKPEEDLQAIKDIGLNTVRIPIGYWATKDKTQASPYPNCSIEFLDKAFSVCERLGLGVIISFHGAKDSQNGWDHSGWARDTQHWTDNWAENLQSTLDSLSFLTSRYTKNKSFLGIEVLNEPISSIPLEKLSEFYVKAYQLIREIDKKIIIVMHDSFRNYALEAETFIPKTSRNFYRVMVDLHNYQCFSEADKQLSTDGHLNKVTDEWQNTISILSKNYLVLTGEWSLGLDWKTFLGMQQEEIKEFKRIYFQTQKNIFEGGDGSCFWTWRIEYSNLGWSLEQLYKQGYFD